ncbi:hypothetical protein JOF41_006250 [Saccharothrix coeruleofusca]|uniref:hypothetical protein n=1 Tax=Saccharothrix coeruleofusca TaxID=33919 RepID=UPI001AE92DD1|nr:hypothetical protein [Saccharothrix coeruleofusca]MBP2340072.1 hypothetical protein [Saccharothrix coeruleofusca]
MSRYDDGPGEVFERALDGEPPLRLDFEAIERAGARSLRRRRAAVPTLTAVAAIVVVGGVVALTGTGSGGPTRVAGPGQSVPAGSPTRTAPAPISTAVPTTRTAGYCYRTADITTDEPDQHVMMGVAGDDPDGRGDVASRLLNICGMAWTENLYGWQGPVHEGGTHTAPQLVACVLDATAAAATDVVAGAAAVFPGTEQTCADMGLPVAELGG